MTPTAGATEQRPTHYITLSDGSDTIGIIPIDERGRDNALAIQRSRYPRMATHISQGHSKYENVNPPYRPITQDNWQSGRGEDDFEDDTERFLESLRANTEHEKQIILGGLETYGTGHRNLNQDMPGDMTWGGTLYSTTLYLARKFTTTAAYTANDVMLWIKRIGSPGGTLNVQIWTDSGGSPDAIIGGASAALAVSSITDVVSELHVFSLGTPPSLSNATTYWVVAYISGSTPDADNHLALGYNPDSSGNTKSSSLGSSWAPVSSRDMYFRVLDNTAWRGKFLEYKRGFYFLSQPLDGGNSSLYLNGDRGIATGGSASTLADTDQTWTTNEWTNAVVLIIKGTGVDQRQPWRTISSNTATVLTISPDWDVNPASGTEYVILGSSKWQSWHSLALPATDAVVAGDAIYVAFGDRGAGNVALYQEYRAGAATAYTQSQVAQNFPAEKLLTIRHPSLGNILWGSVNEDDQHGVAVWKAYVPPLYDVNPLNSQLYHRIGTLVENDDMWDEQSITNVTQTRNDGRLQISIAGGFTTGIVASKSLTTPIDITQGVRLGFLLKSTVAASAGDLRLYLDDTQFLGDSFLADKLWLLDNETPASEVVWYDGTTYNDIPNLCDGDHNTGSYDMAIQTDDYLYVGLPNVFNRLKVDMFVVNTTGSVLTAEIFDGNAWVSQAITDGTILSAATFGKDGEINWTPHSKWTKGTSSAEASDLNQALYWIRFDVSVNVSPDVSFYLFNCEGPSIFLPARYVSLDKAKDGRTTFEEIDISSDDYIIVMFSAMFNKVFWDLGTTVNAVASSTMTAEYFDGEKWTSLTITDNTASGGVTLALDNLDMNFTIPDDWEQIEVEGETGYAVRFTPDKDLTDGIDLVEVYVKNDDVVSTNFPAISTANVWNWITVSIAPNKTPSPDETAITSVGLYLNTDLGAQTITFGSPIYILDLAPEYISVGNTDARITGMEAYGDERENPWIFKEDGIVEIQTENDNLPVSVPLREIRSMRSERNGVAHTVSDVYLVFNLDRNIERYYNRTLEDFGFNKDEGLPDDRQGTVTSLLSYPGRIFASVDAEDSGYSSVLVRRGGGWHEVYRAPKGERIENMGVSVSPGLITRLFISQGSDLVSVPLPKESFNPAQDSNYEYTHESYIVSGWISANFLDVNKLFKSVKLYTENLSGTSQYVKVEYQTETGSLSTSWTEVTSSYSTSPFEENDIAAANDVTARRIRFRVTLYTDDRAVTPILKSYVIEALLRLGIKYQYAVRFKLEDFPADLYGERDMTARIEDTTAIIENWADAPTALTFRCPYSPYDNKTVILEHDGMRPIELVTEEGQVGYEKHFGSINLLEI
jgi:hypothetical protein